MAAPRVLFVTYNFPPKLGGLEQVVWRVWRALDARAEVLTLAQHAPHPPEIPGDVRRAAGEGLARYMGFVLRAGWGLRDVDVVVAASALVAAPVALLARRLGARSCGITYGLDTIHPSPPYQAIYRASVPRLDRVIAISRATREAVLARGVAPERVVLLHPGCDAERFTEPVDVEPLRQRWGLEGARVILSAGRLVRRKGIDRFVRECLPRVVERIPEARMLLAGGNPEGALAHTEDVASLVHAAAREVGLEEHVVVTGRLDDDAMRAAFQLADVFVLPVVPDPADMEGFGIVLLEAAAAGAPCVATRTGGVPDAVADGETGVLVPPLDYPAMAEALVDLLADEERRTRFGRAGRERVLAHFRWDDAAERYADAILSS